MTTSPVLTPVVAPAVSAWDEPDGIPPRGTVVVLTGRGETAASYGRVGRRLAADAYRVRVVEVDSSDPDLDAVRSAVDALVSEENLPAPFVLLGSDAGATVAAALVDELPVEGAVLAGLALPGQDGPVAGADWDSELEARTACPTHRRVISEDAAFDRGALARPLPYAAVSAPAKPVLVLHGSADPVTAPAAAFGVFADSPAAELHLVEGAHHDALNDVMHRSVAATVVLWLERLKLGGDRSAIVQRVQ